MASRSLSLTLYNALLPLGLLLMAPAAFVKMRRRGGQWRDMGQRFGFWNPERRAAIDALPALGRIWMHAVSVGEVEVAKKLIAEILRQQPDQGILFTTTTPTGYRLALDWEKAHPQRVVALYSPLDLSSVARRVLRSLSPAQIVLVEAEVWPNIVSHATAMGIPVSLVNARLSQRSERRYLGVRSLVAPIFGMLTRVCVQDSEDIDRWAGLGVARERIELTGSIKYDPQGGDPQPEQVASLAQLLANVGLAGRPLILAASTHAGEEREFAKVFGELLPRFPELGLLVVPRHYERGSQVLAELQELGLSPVLRSQLHPQSPASATNTMVIDSTGELKAWQQHATIVVIGKSFLAEGGQNPAEAVMAGKPVILGPHMENFLPLVKLLLDARGARQVRGLEELAPVLAELLSRPEQGREMAQAGRLALLRHQGATRKTAALLLKKS